MTKKQEVENLRRALKLFAREMEGKLIQKAAEDYTGWDDPNLAEDLCEDLLRHAFTLQDGEPQELDIANLAMFLWWQREHVKSPVKCD